MTESGPAESAPIFERIGAPREVSMEFKHLVLDPRNQNPIVILVNEEEDCALPIWVDPFQASTIVTALEGVDFPRPLTHDLILNAIEGLGAELERVVIHTLEDATFYAKLVIKDRDGTLREIDARPSDSIVLSVKTDCDIFANNAICDPVSRVQDYLEEAQSEQYRELLASLEPEDISKYKM